MSSTSSSSDLGEDRVVGVEVMATGTTHTLEHLSSSAMVSPSLLSQLKSAAANAGISVESFYQVAWASVLGLLSGADIVSFGFSNGSASPRLILIDLSSQFVRDSLLSAERFLNDPACFGTLSEDRERFEATLAILNAGEDARGDMSAPTEHTCVVCCGQVATVRVSTNYLAGPAKLLEWFLVALSRLVETVERSGEASLTGLDLVTADERQRLLHGWNKAPVPCPEGLLVHEHFEDAANRNPKNTALRCGARTMSYCALDAAAEALATRLIHAGAKPDERIALCMERGIDLAIGILGVLKAGAAYVPLDPSYPIDRLRYMAEDCKAIAIVTTEGRSLAVAEKIAGDTRILLVNASSHVVSRAEARMGGREITSRNLAYVIYTSGSTGRPKGVMVEHQGVSNLAVAQAGWLNVTCQSRVLQIASPSFDASVFEISMALCHGAELVIVPPGEILAGDSLARFIDAYGITHATLTPPVASTLPADSRTQSLQTLVVAGDVMPENLVGRWANRLLLVNAYGPTEATVCSTAYRCRATDRGQPPIGNPISNVRIYILDSRSRLVPVGVQGEIAIGGVGVARGYLGRPELTSERFVPDPFMDSPDAVMYLTGDMGRWNADGTIQFMGRRDSQVKIRGIRIELGEIEAAIMNVPGVHDVVADVRPSVSGRDGEERLVAYFVADDMVDQESIIARLSSRLPGYMIPASYVRLDALPLSPNGKVERKLLPEPEDSFQDVSARELPKTETERRLASIWSEVLGIECIDRGRAFLELGGHSLLQVQVMARIRDIWGLELPISTFLESDTVEKMALAIDVASASHCDTGFPPLVPTRRVPGDAHPLTFPQESIWFLNQYSPDDLSYNAQCAIRIYGQVDHMILCRALDEIVRRHESLRTTFSSKEGVPFQTVHPAGSYTIPVIDLSPLPEANREAELQRLEREECAIAFDVSRLPLFKWLLIVLGPHECELLIIEHHFIHDGWSSGRLLRDLSTIYSAFVDGKPSPLPPLPVQLADFAEWQRRFARGRGFALQLEYWKNKLRDVTPLELPTDFPRNGGNGRPGATIDVELGEDLYGALVEFGKRENATLFAVMLTAYEVLLRGHTGRDDIVIGSSTANRRLKESEELIGMIVNTIVLRTELTGDMTFREALDRTRCAVFEAQQNQDVPFEKVVEMLAPDRSHGKNPFFRMVFGFHDSSQPDLDFKSLRGKVKYLSNGSAKFDLSITVIPRGEQRIPGARGCGDARILMRWEYRTDLFTPETIKRMAERYRLLLRAALADPSSRITDLPMMCPEEHLLLLDEWNRTGEPFPTDKCLHELFEDQAKRTPDRAAVTARGETLSYAELDAAASRLASDLAKLGVAPDSRVGICLERDERMVVAILGVLKAGGAYVPLDPVLPEERQRRILADCNVTALIADPMAENRVIDPGHPPILDPARYVGRVSPATSGCLGISVGSSNLAYVIYTSGSTGTPKGVMVEHRNVVNLLYDWLSRFPGYADGAARNSALWTSFSFDVSVFELFLPLVTGHRVLIVPDEIRADPKALLAWYRAEDIGFAYLPPFFARRVTELANDGLPLPFKHVLVGVEPLPESELHAMRMLAPGLRVVNGYGPTETTVFSAAYADPIDARRIAPIGKPIANTRVYILDPDLRPVPIGVVGELYIAGEGVARGYYGRPDLTAERFLRDPFMTRSETRMYRTGDLARWLPEGNLSFVGRNDSQFKLRGFRVEAGEIETIILEHPAIQEAAVTVIGEGAGREEDRRLVAYYVSREEVMSESLRVLLAANLPLYMVPSSFVRIDFMPLTSNGKLNRAALPVPPSGDPEAGAFEEPVGATERDLAMIWQDLLKVPLVGRNDDFFRLGGHSLLATRLVHRIQVELETVIALSDIFAYPTLSRLATRILNAQIQTYSEEEIREVLATLESEEGSDTL